jgi:ribonuclease HI
MASIQALKKIPSGKKIEIYTDSKYVKMGITEWIKNWKKNNWKTSSKKKVKNIELWKELDNLSEKHQIKWSWVKGHSGNVFNEEVDQLAREAAI